MSFEEMRAGDTERMKLVAEPDEEITKIYDGLVESYTLCEDFVVKTCEKVG
jgi:xylulokinase